MKKRKLFYKVEKYLDHKNAIVVTGIRQVGKTTLLKQLFDHVKSDYKVWFDLDNPLDQLLFENTDYHAIYRELVTIVKSGEERLFIFLDEIQNLPAITRVMKFLIDHYQVKFVVTGSSSFYLRNLFPESLSGRKFLFYLPPLSFQEALYFHNKVDLDQLLSNELNDVLKQQSLYHYKKQSEEYLRYLQFGGFPEVVTTVDDDLKKMVLKNIFSSFFEKDLRLLSDFREIRELRDLIRLLAPRVGSMLDITRIASELSVDRKKIYAFLDFLQGTYFIHLLPKYAKGIDRSVAGGKKVYFSDNGILNLLGPITESQLLENAVINQLAIYGELSFYNYRNTSEIDCILDKKIAFEIKQTGTEHDYKKLSKLTDKLGIRKKYIISQNFRDMYGIVYPQFL
ncbi:MAG: ATP-binding protein [Bacteroidales bacterium]|nr:ATP-binding protein [Bacteroidota bacterium]MBL6949163.1 ATP-binding protein [Bacteroidales bacterium]